LAVEEVTEALAVDKDGIHVCCVLEVSKVLLGLALGLGLGLGLRFGLGSGSGQVGVPRGEKIPGLTLTLANLPSPARAAAALTRPVLPAR
jgi:hypothetical protein